ncbi:hypothetical protein ABH926_005621 [Catenulispora sp. GP43]|uniref:hypothetical protein n=1 Tax=Catenulispora sp. GP43 TaxID=3156263 RepID=UPI003513EED8
MRITSAQRRAGVAFAVVAAALMAAAAPASADTGGRITPGTPAIKAGPDHAANGRPGHEPGRVKD